MRRSTYRLLLVTAAVAACIAVPAPAVANTDQLGDTLGFYNGVIPAQCTSQFVDAWLALPGYLTPHALPPAYSDGLTWADYFGIPFAITPPSALPLHQGQPPIPGPFPGAWEWAGYDVPLDFSGLPYGVYDLHELLWNSGLFLGVWLPLPGFGTLDASIVYRPGVNPDCSIISMSTRATAVSPAIARSAMAKPPYRTIIARLRAAKRNARSLFFRTPRAMTGSHRIPARVRRTETRLRARIASLWRR